MSAAICGVDRNQNPDVASLIRATLAKSSLSVLLPSPRMRRRQRMLEEEPQHFPRSIRSSRIGVGARRAASRPCVCSAVDVPMLKDSTPARVDVDRAGIGVPSGYPPAMHALFGARRFYGLLKNLIAVTWMHGNVAIAVKDDGRESRSAT